MHLLETYSLATGGKIDKPFIYTTFFPLPVERYITFQAQSKFNSKNYDFWQDVLNILYPILESVGIKIVQVGSQNEYPYQYVIDLKGRTDIHQLAYVIQNSLLHLGPDSLGIHISSFFDIPIVGLYSCSPRAISGPYFGTCDKQIIFEGYKRTKNGKPSYAAEEAPKSINTINPEEIAGAVLKLLGIDRSIPFETVYIGSKYSHNILRELVPNCNIQVQGPSNIVTEVRMDLEYNEQFLFKQLQTTRCAIVTDKPISLDKLKPFRPNIAAIVYEIKDNDDPAFAAEARKFGVPMILVSSLSQELINEKKNSYYEIGKINKFESPDPEIVDKLKSIMPNLYFKANKILASNNQFYMTNAARVTNQPITNDFEYYKAHDVPEFWNNLAFFACVQKIS